MDVAGGPVRGADGRLHHFDALRALAMLLGVEFHASVFDRPRTGSGADVLRWLPAFIHTFRMPLFFLMAGVFAAMLLDRRGELGFVRNRAERIALPLLVGTATIVPLQVALPYGPRGAPLRLTLGAPAHLWFLEFLLVFYVIGLALRRSPALRLAPAIRGRVLPALFGGRVPALRLAAVAAGLLILLGGRGGNPARTFLPDPRQLLYFGLFFGLGWLLFSDLHPLRALERRPWIWAAVALALSLPLPLAERRYGAGGETASLLDGRVPLYLVLGPLVGMAALAALYGFAVRLCSKPRPVIRYLVDASYWIYLMHIVVLAAVNLALEPLGLPWWIHYPALCGTTTAVLLLTYAAFVRFTVIGRVLHGPRARGKLVPAAQAA